MFSHRIDAPPQSTQPLFPSSPFEPLSSYEEKYRGLIERYEAAKEKIGKLETELAERKSKKEKIDIFLKELQKKKELLTEFDEGLWSIMVDTMTVYSKERVVFKFRDGTTVEWQISK